MVLNPWLSATIKINEWFWVGCSSRGGYQFCFIGMLKKKTVHEYIVKVRGTSIGFYRAGTLQCQGKLNSITMQQSPLKTCLEMKINDAKIIFIVRPKENYIRNSFLATGSLYDVEVMEELYHDLSQGTV